MFVLCSLTTTSTACLLFSQKTLIADEEGGTEGGRDGGAEGRREGGREGGWEGGKSGKV